MSGLFGPYELFGYGAIAFAACIPLIFPLPPGMQTVFWGGLAVAAFCFIGSGLYMHGTKFYKTGRR